MTPEQIALARHALGFNYGAKVSFRNYFISGPPADDYAQWLSMVKVGYAVRCPGSELTGGDDIFHRTLRGANAAIRADESLDPEGYFPSGGVAP